MLILQKNKYTRFTTLFMKKNHYFLLCAFVLICATSPLFAKKIDQQTAMLVAKKFYYEASASKNIEYDKITVSEFFEIKRDGNSVYYAFNFDGGGFVIVAADDLFTPIIGYNTEGAYNETDAPCNWQWLMSEFADMIAFGQQQKMEANPEYLALWQHLIATEPSLPCKNREVVVSPLCKAMWNQDSPYNYYAPSDPKGPGGKAYAGCVATAMSIIMHYWQWPKKGTSSHTYYPSNWNCSSVYPLQTAHFGDTEYHFEGMLNKITYGLDNPVALLMYHCGVAVDMMYCYSGSGAYSDDVPNAIKKYFKYDNSANIYDKEYMSELEWKNMLKTDLNKGYPLYNSGCSNAGCHAFVCDGYTTDDLFHYNFGWGGAANGYYTVNNVYGFYSWQSVINNFIPDVTQYNAACQEFTLVPFIEGTIADCSGPVQNYKPNISTSWLIDPEAGGDLSKKTTTIEWEFLDLAQGDFLRIYDGESDTTPLLAEYTAESQPQKLVSTNSKVFIRFTSGPTSETAKGFKLNFKSTPVMYCKYSNITTFTEPEGTFSDGSEENYYYPNSTQCRWYITPENAQSIEITFNYLETEAKKDILRIFDPTTNKTIAYLSGFYTQENLPVVTVPSGKAQIYFTTNNTINAKGFELNYKAIQNGIKQQNQAVNALTLFPNPSSTHLNLSFSTPHSNNIKIEILNILGENIFYETLTDFSGNYQKTINIEMLSDGIYFMKVISSKGISVMKFIKN